MPLVCPDGAVAVDIVADARKRQLAGQAWASAVDRTRLCLADAADSLANARKRQLAWKHKLAGQARASAVDRTRLVLADTADFLADARKRQLSGQAWASAVDRTRLAVKAFTDRKRRFFPHLEDNSFAQACDSEHRVAKKCWNSQRLNMGPINGLGEENTLSDILNNLGHEESNVRIFRYQHLDWLRRASSFSFTPNESLMDPSKEQGRNMSNLRAGSTNVTDIDKVAVIELLAPSVFRAIVSLHSAGSVNPDAVAFFSPDEEGNYIHARGFSVHHVFRHITEYSDKALQYFVSMDKNISLYLLLRWICSYQRLMTQLCSKCGRLLMMDEGSALLLPPVHRPYKGISAANFHPSQLPQSSKGQSRELTTRAYHVGCSIEKCEDTLL